MAKIEIHKSKLLLVEGNHERDFFEAWLAQLGIIDIQVMPIAGKTLLRENLEIVVKRPQFQDGKVVCLVVVRDADDNPAGAFQSVSDALVAYGLTPPAGPWMLADGVVPRTGIVLMPALNSHGALEELLLQTVQADALATEANQYIQFAVDTLNVNGQRRPPPPHRYGKAKIHAFLSTFEEPDKDPGKAALSGVWDFTHPALTPLLQILQQM